MPPKTTGPSGKAQGPSKRELEAINKYLAQRPDFEKLLNEAAAESTTGTSKREATEYERALKEAIAASKQ